MSDKLVERVNQEAQRVWLSDLEEPDEQFVQALMELVELDATDEVISAAVERFSPEAQILALIVLAEKVLDIAKEQRGGNILSS